MGYSVKYKCVKLDLSGYTNIGIYKWQYI